MSRAVRVVVESRRGRRLVGRLQRGDVLPEALLTVCATHGVAAGDVRGSGALEEVELAAFDQAARSYHPPRRLTGGVELLSFHGLIATQSDRPSLSARVTLMRERDTGLDVLGGVLVSARVFSFEYVLETFDDVRLERERDDVTGLVVLCRAAPVALTSGAPDGDADGDPDDASDEEASSPAPPPPPPPRSPRPAAPAPTVSATRPASPARAGQSPASPPAGASWADVARASAQKETVAPPRPPRPPVAPRDEDEDDGGSEELDASGLVAGDVIVHPTFGRCEVQRIEGAQEFAQVRLRNGRLVRLSLDVLRLQPDGTEGGRRVFRAKVAG